MLLPAGFARRALRGETGDDPSSLLGSQRTGETEDEQRSAGSVHASPWAGAFRLLYMDHSLGSADGISAIDTDVTVLRFPFDAVRASAWVLRVRTDPRMLAPACSQAFAA